MGFLNRTVFAKRLNKTNLFVLAILVGIISCGLATVFSSSSTFAEEVVDNFGLYTDSDGVRWEWEVVSDSENTDEPQKLNLMFYDKPENLTTVTVPSYTDMTTITGVTPISDTYYVRNANQESQDTRFSNPDPARRTTNQADVTVLDMTNTSKVQIMGVRPIINPETEVELIFGENMVIGDGVEITKSAVVDVCTSMIYYDSYRYKCAEFEERDFNEVQDSVEGWNNKTIPEKQNYQLSLTDLVDCNALSYFDFLNPSFWGYGSYGYNDTKCYARIVSRSETIGGVFSNYRLKLTNLQNIKYFGWFAFSDSVLNEINYSISIKANQTAGEGVFEGTNVRNVSFEGTTTYPAMFRNCSDLESIDFGNVETVSYSTFENSPVGTSLDLSTTSIKTVLGKAFKNSGISELNLGSVEKLGFEAFASNSITDLDFPKTIKELRDKDAFLWNPLQNITVRFDTSQSNIGPRFVESLGCAGERYNETTGTYSGHNHCVNINLKKLDIVAPYGEDEEVSPTHIYISSSEYGSENFQPWTYKNVIANNYFNGLGTVEEINIGEGIQYIGDSAFYSYHFANRAHNELKKIVFPDSLVGIGQHAFEKLISGNGGDAEGAYVNGYWVKQAHPDVELPSGLVYIGTKAFLYNTGLNTRFDLPDLEYLGNSAFENTNVMDIYFHHKLKYAGEHAFYYYTGDSGYNDGYHIWEGKRNVTFDSMNAINVDVGAYYFPARVKFGTITFGEHITSLGAGDYAEHLDDDGVTFRFGSGGAGGTAWHKVSVDKFDMSASQVTAIPAAYFNGIYADEIVLPHNLKFIGSAAFYSATVNKELVLPDSLEVISGGAFNAAYFQTNCDPQESFYDNLTISLGVKITKLPSSLKKVGKAAFFGDINLTAVVDAELEDIRMNAFTGTGITGVVLHSTTTSVGMGAFTANEYLRNIEIDADILGNYPRFGDLFGYGWVINNGASYDWSYIGTSISGGIYKSVDINELNIDSVVIKGNSLHAPVDEQTTYKSPCEYGAYDGDDWYCANADGSRGSYRSTMRGLTAYFYGFNIDSVDLSDAGWSSIPRNMFLGAKIGNLKLPSRITSVPEHAFYNATIEEPVEIPSGVTTIGTEAFQYSNIGFSNALPEGVTTIEKSAFYSADIHGDFTIPSTVQSIGYSAFNATETDTHYDTVTIKPALNYSSASNQAIFQMFWNASMDKLVIESPMLPVLGSTQGIMPGEVEAHTANGVETLQPQELRADGEPEFHGMTMREVEIKNLPTITANAFEECANLETVSFANHTNLQEIAQYAFNNDTKLKRFVFGDGLVGKDVALKEYAFNNTAVETIGNYNTDFDLTAANFNTVQEHVFSNMPKLKSVDIPNNFNIDENLVDEKKNFNGSRITSFTFSDDPELEQVTVAYQVAEIRDGAFLNDEKLTKLFIWGNTDIQESDDLIRDFNNTTIPHGTNIFAYSDAPAENYANDDSRSTYDGKFYPLDEVLYLTSNKTYVILEQDEEGNNVDFEKDGLILYALRRDGVILESDDWQTYTKAFTRASNPNIVFEEGKGAAGNLGTDEELMWTVYDAPKPFDTISLANQNYQATDFEFIQMPSSTNPLVAIHYPDGYTAAIRTTTLASMTKEEEEEMLKELEVPNTGAFQTIASIAAPSVSIATIVVLGGIYIARKRKN